MLGLKSAGEKAACLTYLVVRTAAPTLGEGGEGVPDGRRPPERRRKAMSAITSFHPPVSRAPFGSAATGQDDACRGKRVTERGTIRSPEDRADRGVAAPEGLYDPSLDKDSCGVGFIADIKGRQSHKIVADALTILLNLQHRGAVGADPHAGDGAGILVQIPHRFFVNKAPELGFALPAPGDYAVGVLFMPREESWRRAIQDVFAEEIAREGMR